MNKVLAMVLAGGEGNRLSILAEERAKPAVPFGGSYRIIDFTLSNCVNSGINRVALLTQYRPRSLMEHIGIGRPWDLDRSSGGVFFLQPHVQRKGSDWYHGTADAIHQNLDFVAEQPAEQVLILAGDHVYKMHYEQMLNFHRFKGADVTVGVVEVPVEETSRYGIVGMDDGGRVVSFEEKPRRAGTNLASMGIYAFSKECLIRTLEYCARQGHCRDFGRDVIPTMLREGNKVLGYRFAGYWRDVGTLESYWAANMDLLVDLPDFNLYDREIPILTTAEPRPPVKTGPHARISRSLVSHGCIINGEVRNSVLSPGVYVEEGAVVDGSIIFHDTVVSQGASIHRAILDKQVWVGSFAHVGVGEDYTPNHEQPAYLNTGLTIVGKRARIPADIHIGRNVKVNPAVEESDFGSEEISSGSTIERGKDGEPYQITFIGRGGGF